jgi:hypothetical protein
MIAPDPRSGESILVGPELLVTENGCPPCGGGRDGSLKEEEGIVYLLLAEMINVRRGHKKVIGKIFQSAEFESRHHASDEFVLPNISTQ